jgi:ribosome biogenesis GTPase
VGSQFNTVPTLAMQLFDLGWNSSWEAHFKNLSPAAAWAPARVVRQDRGRVTVVADAGVFSATVSGRFKHHYRNVIDQPAVGDWVAFEDKPETTAGRIHAVLPRSSQFVRKAAGKSNAPQVVAANIDTLFLVTGLDQNFNLRRIERYLTVAEQSGAAPVIVLNKADLAPDLDSALAAVEAIASGVPIVALCAFEATQLEALRTFLRPGQTAALLGSSGVGKSTLLNAFAGEDLQVIQENRGDDSRGRHTTTTRELFRLPNGALLIDTPGMRELGLVDQGEPVGQAFKELDALTAQCRFSDCQHSTEPGCAVQAAIAAGTLGAAHFEHWQRLQREQAHAARQQDARLQRIENAKWKKISALSRQRDRFDEKNGGS